MYKDFSTWLELRESGNAPDQDMTPDSGPGSAPDQGMTPDSAPEASWLKKVRYGNYCGPGPYLNKQTCNVLRDGQPMPQPKNQVDAHCRQHDIDYCMCGASSSSGVLGFGNDCTYDADRKLVVSLDGLVKDQNFSDAGEKRAAAMIRRYFQLHNALHRFKKSFGFSGSSNKKSVSNNRKTPLQ